MLMNVWETAVINKHSLISLSVFPSVSVYCSLEQISLSLSVCLAQSQISFSPSLCCLLYQISLSIFLILSLAWSDLSLSLSVSQSIRSLSMSLILSLTWLDLSVSVDWSIKSLSLILIFLSLSFYCLLSDLYFYLSLSFCCLLCQIPLFKMLYSLMELELIGTWKNWSKSHWAFGFNLWLGGLCDVRVDRRSFGSCNMWADKQGEAAGVEQRPWPATYTTTKKAREQIVRNQ